mmetsp:Transcript_40968/g.162201  ORF Transcript_40968/g.162201 Transcript_40968/m.162201 type:complete len:142 (-) Transcript_40968:709-1134(-)
MVDSKVDEWADIEDDEYQLPPREETKTADGLKKVTEYSISVDGFLKKTITTTRESKVVHKVSKGVADRRGWKRFGQCANAPPGPEQGITAVSKDTVLIEWVTQIDEVRIMELSFRIFYRPLLHVVRRMLTTPFVFPNGDQN